MSICICEQDVTEAEGVTTSIGCIHASCLERLRTLAHSQGKTLQEIGVLVEDDLSCCVCGSSLITPDMDDIIQDSKNPDRFFHPECEDTYEKMKRIEARHRSLFR